MNQDYDHAGRVSVALFKKLLPSNHYDFLICGPPPMMDSMIEDLKDWGVPDDRVHFERFGPGPPKRPPVKPVGDEVGTKFEITFKRSGKNATWTPAIGSILDLARACDVPIDSGCERGDCGTCQTAIRTGSVAYTDPPSFECEAGTCLVCCSVPQGPLVLDA